MRGKEAIIIAIIGAVLLVSCQGAVKKGVAGLKAEVDSLKTVIGTGTPFLTDVNNIAKETEKLAKLSKDDITNLLNRVDAAKKGIEGIIGIEPTLSKINDSLNVLKGKVSTAMKDTIDAIKGDVNVLLAKLEEFKTASVKLDEIKAKLEESQKTLKGKEEIKAPAKAKTVKKKVPVKKK